MIVLSTDGRYLKSFKYKSSGIQVFGTALSNEADDFAVIFKH